MSAAHPHLDVESLSALLDAALPASQTVAANEHLESCRDCQTRLSALRDAVSTLRLLDRVTPPLELRVELSRSLQLSGKAPRLRRHFDRALLRAPTQVPLLLVLVLIVGLGVAAYVIAHGVAARGGAEATAGRLAVGASRPSAGVERMLVAGRIMVRSRVGWYEEGLAEDYPTARTVSRGHERFWRRHPELEPFSKLPGRVLVRTRGGDVVAINDELLPPATAPGDASSGQ